MKPTYPVTVIKRPDWKYVPSVQTDIRKTIEAEHNRIKRQQKLKQLPEKQHA